MVDPIRPNPLAVLEFTPELARLLREKPGRLLKIAESHHRWLLAALHPDIKIGDSELPRKITAALNTVKDSVQLEQAIEDFLNPTDAVRETLITQLRLLETALNREKEEHAALTRRAKEEIRRLGGSVESHTSALGQWALACLMPEDEILVYSPQGVMPVNLTGKVLVLEPLRSKFNSVMLIGQKRRILKQTSMTKKRLAEFLKGNTGFLVENPRDQKSVVLIGSLIAPTVEWAKKIVPLKPAELAKVFVRLRPGIEVGKPIMTLGLTEDGAVFLDHDPLADIVDGSLKVVERARWLPSVPQT